MSDVIFKLETPKNAFAPSKRLAIKYLGKIKQETRMLSQALNRAMPHSRNQLEGVDRKKLIFYLAVQLYLYCTLKQ